MGHTTHCTSHRTYVNIIHHTTHKHTHIPQIHTLGVHTTHHSGNHKWISSLSFLPYTHSHDTHPTPHHKKRESWGGVFQWLNGTDVRHLKTQGRSRQSRLCCWVWGLKWDVTLSSQCQEALRRPPLTCASHEASSGGAPGEWSSGLGSSSLNTKMRAWMGFPSCPKLLVQGQSSTRPRALFGWCFPDTVPATSLQWATQTERQPLWPTPVPASQAASVLSWIKTQCHTGLCFLWPESAARELNFWWIQLWNMYSLEIQFVFLPFSPYLVL